ncbi:hypothetical protein Scep_022430 [Stephania cephalantha]|uniref:Ubiquitin conjugation factor E4 core domain-containing protein n=1 Tax=Stephania cephalantha TaxID=152367 RepID=A0AAP0I256_9MAGN
MQEQARSPQLELDIARVEKEIESYPQEKLCYEAQIRDGAFIQHALSFYRLMVVWLVNLVGGFKMPLPLTCPMEFACMPEHFIEDALELRQLCQEDANNRPTMSTKKNTSGTNLTFSRFTRFDFTYNGRSLLLRDRGGDELGFLLCSFSSPSRTHRRLAVRDDAGFLLLASSSGVDATCVGGNDEENEEKKKKNQVARTKKKRKTGTARVGEL